jgi:hypothetical protein
MDKVLKGLKKSYFSRTQTRSRKRKVRMLRKNFLGHRRGKRNEPFDYSSVTEQACHLCVSCLPTPGTRRVIERFLHAALFSLAEARHSLDCDSLCLCLECGCGSCRFRVCCGTREPASLRKAVAALVPRCATAVQIGGVPLGGAGEACECARSRAVWRRGW